MAYGLKIENQLNQLVVNSDAVIPYCWGRASYVSHQNAYGDAETTSGRRSGYLVYRAYVTGNIVVGLDLPINVNVSILGITNFGDHYDILVYAGTSLDSYNFDTVMNQIDVFIFKEPEYVIESYGLALFDSNGKLTADFSRPGLLLPKGTVSTYGLSSGADLTLPALNRPVIVGAPAYIRGVLTPRGESGALYTYNLSRRVFKRYSQTSLKVWDSSMEFYLENDAGDPPIQGTFDSPSICTIIEGYGLP